MTWWERRGFNAFHVIVAVTGVVYLYMKYAMATDDPFAIINHPWQPAMLSMHVVAAPLFVAFFGMLFRSHSFAKIRSTNPANRRTGWTSLLGFSAMALSGYLIQVATTPALITFFIWTHVAASTVFVVGYGIHLVNGWRIDRVSSRFASRFAVPLLVCLGAAACGLAAAPAPWRQPVRVERTVFLMGTVATFVAEAIDRDTALAKLERMVRVIEETEAELSTWRDDSVLGGVNRQPVGESAPLPDETCRLLARVADWHETTGGAFDPAVGSLIDAWGLRGAARQPDDALLEAARAASGLEHLVLDTQTCAVTRRAAVILDAGAFGKGEALDRVREAERDHPGAWFIDFGGQMAVWGEAAGGAWPIDMAHPARRDIPVLDLQLAAGSLATSGGSERDLLLDSGVRIGHIIDPRTGRPVARAASVTVWHEDAFTADVLSTTLYVMGPEEGLAWAETRGLAACFLIAGDGAGDMEFRATAAFAARFPVPPR